MARLSTSPFPLPEQIGNDFQAHPDCAECFEQDEQDERPDPTDFMDDDEIARHNEAMATDPQYRDAIHYERN